MGSKTVPKKAREQRPMRLLLWTALASLICGLLGSAQIIEDSLRTVRNNSHPSSASGDIVFVGIDDQSLSKVGRWPWARREQGRLIELVSKQGSRKVFVDLIYDSPGEAADDAALQQALARSANVTLADRSDVGISSELRTAIQPLNTFTQHTETASITVDYNYQNAVWKAYLGASIGSTFKPTFAAALADTALNRGDAFFIDYSIDPRTVPYVSASDILNGKSPIDLRNKIVIIGLNADQLGDQYWLPGWGKMAGAYVHVLAAETLKRGIPDYFGWIPALILTLVVCWLAIRLQSAHRKLIILGSALITVLVAPLIFELKLIFVDVGPALLAVMIIGSRLTYRHLKYRGMLAEGTGVPTLLALRGQQDLADQALIVTRVHNHAEIAAALTEEERFEVSRQIVARLGTGGGAKLFQGEDGTFAWPIDGNAQIGNHLEALHAMFRSPVSVAGRQIDIALSFGVEIGSSPSVSSRLAAAVLAADEAWNEGLRWKLHDPSRQEEVKWRVSLLGELDLAIDQGEVWLAYQPQYDISRGQIVGAEALARWTHPDKGPISPSEFVAAAETAGRIGKLTDFVLDRAISSAAAINRRGVEFQIAVNLSARLLSDRGLLGRIEKMLAAHGLPPERLTLELTETATLQDADSGLATLDALRIQGVRIAIDDYGTGLSTLEYLKKIPANEIKIDQSFIKSMRVNRSDLIMVQSTIALAHSLGRTVVAEGVEDRQCLEDLTQMGCDIAQGFAIGRPMGVRELVQRLSIRNAKRVA